MKLNQNIVIIDEKEKGQRELLNFGHTIGHALELVSNYTITHGHAVAIGLVVESYLSFQSKLLTKDDFNWIKFIVSLFDLPLTIPASLSKEAIKQACMRDKKTRQLSPRFVLLERIGRPVYSDNQYAMPVDDTVFDKTLTDLLSGRLGDVYEKSDG